MTMRGNDSVEPIRPKETGNGVRLQQRQSWNMEELEGGRGGRERQRVEGSSSFIAFLRFNQAVSIILTKPVAAAP